MRSCHPRGLAGSNARGSTLIQAARRGDRGERRVRDWRRSCPLQLPMEIRKIKMNPRGGLPHTNSSILRVSHDTNHDALALSSQYPPRYSSPRYVRRSSRVCAGARFRRFRSRPPRGHFLPLLPFRRPACALNALSSTCDTRIHGCEAIPIPAPGSDRIASTCEIQEFLSPVTT